MSRVTERPPAAIAWRLPPQSKQAEAAVLGSVIRDWAVAPDVLARLRAEDFYFDAHQRVYRAVARLVDAAKPVDLVTLGEDLVAARELADAGGAAYLADLFDAAPTAANWEYYAAAVREAAALRAVIHHATEAVRDAFDRSDDADGIAARLVSAIEDAVADRAAGDPVLIEEAVAAGLDDFERRQDRSAPRLWTGFDSLDQVVPGFDPGNLVIVGARPSVGKTSLGLSLALHAGLCGRPAYFASLEMSRVELGQRVAAMVTGAPTGALRAGRATDAHREQIGRARQLVAGMPLYVDDTPRMRVAQVAAAARRVKRKRGLGLVVVDYVQLVAPDDRRADRREQVGQVSRSLKGLARDLGVPVVALAQLNREVENRGDGKPRMSDLREAGDLEQDADVVMLLWRHPNQPEDAERWRVGLKVDKNRNGPVGEITLDYVRASTRFAEPADDLRGF